jgi:hypothetical protein
VQNHTPVQRISCVSVAHFLMLQREMRWLFFSAGVCGAGAGMSAQIPDRILYSTTSACHMLVNSPSE